ncbi:pilus assembly FimT family protein [Thermus thermophilus]|uniref:pilus assembly FimT family protein n=1 Tax=Thermus thermophilus TaxID=274 RepID=UPI001CC6892A|nr:prepilin-type N-terminal cleavage/methylation domain-containing protein [Thermus thermophilus]
MQTLEKRGLTVIELLVVIGFLAVLFGLVGANLLGLRRQLTLEDAANTFSQDVQTCRTNALSWGDNCRIRVLDAASYVMERGAGPGSYSTVLTRSFPTGVRFANVGGGAWLEFNPRTLLSSSPGFPSVGGGVVAPEVRITDGTKTVRLVLSMTGAVKTAMQ